MSKGTKYFFITLLSVFILLTSINLYNSVNNTRRQNLLAMSDRTFNVKAVHSKSNDAILYTQGLILEEDGTMLESGGLYNQSTLTRMKYPSSKIVSQTKLKNNQFAEGIAKVGSKIYQLTWRERTINVYDSDTLEKTGELEMDKQMKEGWGLGKYKNNELIATDSTDKIFFLDDQTLKVKRYITVMSEGRSVSYINALDFDGTNIYANVYLTSNILKIDPETGNVLKTYELNNLVKNEINSNTLNESRFNGGDVLNGIAYDANRKLFILTGKRWGHFYEVELN